VRQGSKTIEALVSVLALTNKKKGGSLEITLMMNLLPRYPSTILDSSLLHLTWLHFTRRLIAKRAHWQWKPAIMELGGLKVK